MTPPCEVYTCVSNGPAHGHMKREREREREIYRIGFFYKKNTHNCN